MFSPKYFNGARRLALIPAAAAILAFSLLYAQEPPASTPPQAKAAPDGGDMQGPFMLVDESPAQVVKIIEALSGQIAIQSAQIPDAKINFASTGKISREDAILALKSVLAVNGITTTPMGEKFFKVEVAQDGAGRLAPQFLFGSALDLPPSQQIYSKLYELKYIDVDRFREAILPMIGMNKGASFSMFSRSNALILTDALVNHQRIETLLKELDKPVAITEEIEIIQLKNMSADELKRKIQSLKSDALRRYMEKTSIESDERTNQVVVVTEPGNMAQIKEIIAKLDVDSQALTTSEVFYIKHGKANDIHAALEKVVSGQQAAQKNAQNEKAAETAATNRANRDHNFRNRNNQNAQMLPTNLKPDNDANALQFSEYITLVPDERSNAIVVYGTESDIRQIGSVINKLDIVLNQVKIDVIITEVKLNANQVSGLSTFGLSYSLTEREIGGTNVSQGWAGSTSMWNLSDSDGSPFAITADERGFSAVFNVAERNNSVKVLSAPTVVTTHNQKASIVVSEQRPIIKGTTSYATDSPTTKSEVEYKDIGIQLYVTPYIGENGVVQMEIEQTVSTVTGNTTIDGNQQPIIGKREAKSYVSAKDGETIVLGGLQQTSNTDTDGAVWLLSDIPLIGDWFKPASDQRERTELIIFIRPTLIKSQAHNKELTQKEMGKSEVGTEVQRYFDTGRFHDQNNDDLTDFKQSSFFRTLYPYDTGENKAQRISNPEKLEQDKKLKEQQAAEEEAARQQKTRIIGPRKR